MRIVYAHYTTDSRIVREKCDGGRMAKEWLLPIEECGQKHKANPECCIWPTTLQLALLVHRQPFTQEQDLGGDCATRMHASLNESGYVTQRVSPRSHKIHDGLHHAISGVDVRRTRNQ